MMSSVIWRPGREHLEKSRIALFMKRQKIASYDELIRRSTSDTEWFWNEALKDLGIVWDQPYRRLLDLEQGFPWARWFVGGTINIVRNCLDRHLPRLASKTAVLWEGDDGTTREITYQALNEEVSRLASAMKKVGIGPGDAVGILMPMVPEIVSVLYACLKIGAAFIPIFSGFGPEAVAVRLADSGAKLLFTADGVFRRGKVTPIKPTADAAALKVPSLKTVVVLKCLDDPIPWHAGRDVLFPEFASRGEPQAPTESLPAEATAMIMYTSGTTGRPKGCVLTQGGSLAQIAKEVGYYFDVGESDRFFWFTDIGWMMGPWEIIGTHFFGGTVLIYSGAPDWPTPARVWQLVEKFQLTHFGISPTAIRLLRRYGDEIPDRFPVASLRILGSTGEPWDSDSYMWFFEKVGKRRLPIINISGGTEIVGCHLSPLPITELKPCTLRGPGLGMDIDVWNDKGQPVRDGQVGYLVCKKPAPSMTKGFLNDRERYLETYFSKWPDVWYHGDWASIDSDGFWFLHGRADDTIKVAGKRTGPAEIEAALIEHPAVSEAAAIGVPDEIKGEAVVCFVVLKPAATPSDSLAAELKNQVVKFLGKTLLPKAIHFVLSIPKTRSAKIVRGAIKRKYLGQPPGDLSSVENPEALAKIPSAA